jgi:hypothetical protein
MTREGVLAEMRDRVKKKHKIYRSAETGRIVTEEYAKEHPKETVSEVVITGESDNTEDVKQSDGESDETEGE